METKLQCKMFSMVAEVSRLKTVKIIIWNNLIMSRFVLKIKFKKGLFSQKK